MNSRVRRAVGLLLLLVVALQGCAVDEQGRSPQANLSEERVSRRSEIIRSILQMEARFARSIEFKAALRTCHAADSERVLWLAAYLNACAKEHLRLRDVCDSYIGRHFIGADVWDDEARQGPWAASPSAKSWVKRVRLLLSESNPILGGEIVFFYFVISEPIGDDVFKTMLMGRDETPDTVQLVDFRTGRMAGLGHAYRGGELVPG